VGSTRTDGRSDDDRSDDERADDDVLSFAY
jgi:hypothetical protein